MTIACVYVGTRYSQHYVTRLRSMAKRYADSEHRFICLTDSPEYIQSLGVEAADIGHERLSGWWAKMKLFDAAFRKQTAPGRWVYFDLDTVLLGSIQPLLEWKGEFGICANFTRLSGHLAWPCKYGSCVMSLAEGFGQQMWEKFNKDRSGYIRQCTRGDQELIEHLYPNATLLQDVLPAGFFIGYRDLEETAPQAAVVVFAGNHKPDNSPLPWVREAWV